MLNSFDALIAAWPKPLKSCLRTKRSRDEVPRTDGIETNEGAEGRAKRQKTEVTPDDKKNVHWPEDTLLCQTQLFSKNMDVEEGDDQSTNQHPQSLEASQEMKKDRYPGKERHPNRRPGTVSSSSSAPAITTMEAQIPWSIPPLLVLPENCRLNWGESSTEKITQAVREKNALSAHYFAASDIPDNPLVPSNPEPDYDEALVRLVPTVEPDNVEAALPLEEVQPTPSQPDGVQVAEDTQNPGCF